MAASAGELFEASSPLARRLGNPSLPPDQLVARARALLPQLSEEEKIATLNAHPRLGEDPARMSERSRREQAQGAGGESSLERELAELNAEYEAKFGFRFVSFVNRRPRQALVAELRDRLQRPRDRELATGLEAIVDIAQDRVRS